MFAWMQVVTIARMHDVGPAAHEVERPSRGPPGGDEVMSDWLSVERAKMARRLRQVRIERFGEDGMAIAADLMCVTAETWRGYEMGDAIPALVVLQFSEITGASPAWLLTGRGWRFAVERTPS